MVFRIEANESFQVLAMTRVFSEETSQRDIPAFWSEFMSKGYGDYVCGEFGICHSYQPGEFSYSIADTYRSEKAIREGFELLTIPAFTWAKFTCIGPMPTAIQTMWQEVYQKWLPESAYRVIPGYDIEMYTAGDINSAEYVSEIWIPVEQK